MLVMPAPRRDASVANAAQRASRGVKAPRQLTTLPALSLDLFLSNSHSLFTFAGFFFLHCLSRQCNIGPPSPRETDCQASLFKVAPMQTHAEPAGNAYVIFEKSNRIRGIFN